MPFLNPKLEELKFGSNISSKTVLILVYTILSITTGIPNFLLFFDPGFIISMSSKGNPYDNAFLESLMKTLKYEEVHLKEYETATDVLENLPKFIEDVYNKKRLHSGIGHLPPEEFEAKLLTVAESERSILHL